MTDTWGTHQGHCCFKHGCKYGEEDCPVAKGLIEQDYPCPYCPTKEQKRILAHTLGQHRLIVAGVCACGENFNDIESWEEHLAENLLATEGVSVDDGTW